MKDIFAYTDFLDFWAWATPETPFGRDAHEKPGLCHDIESLEKTYDRTDALLSLLDSVQTDPARLALISHHLKRLPRFPTQAQQGFDEIELFQIKKFLHNYTGLMGQLPENVHKLFGFEYHSEALEEVLNRGAQSPETFYIADDYSTELAETRAAILALDVKVQILETERAAEIKKQFGLDFSGRPFLLVPKERLGDCTRSAQFLAIEPYDDSMYSVRPTKSATLLTLNEKREVLAQRERICEEFVLKFISTVVMTELPNLLKYRDAATIFDLAWARARTAREKGLTRPRLHTNNSIRIIRGRFFPCEMICEKHDIPYTPLDAEFTAGPTVIFGSNMGGKTIVLQTVALLQLAAQAGLFVPAEYFETRIFHNFHYIGERRGEISHQGLSGFAMEMQQLIQAWRNITADTEGTLLFMDEFARTTSSSEAEAILAAVLETITQKANALVLCSTHFHGLPRIQNVRFLRMAGLGQSELPGDTRRHLDLDLDPVTPIRNAQFITQNSEYSSNIGIREIVQRMNYRLVSDDGKKNSDAIVVAQLLGLDDKLLKCAETFFIQNAVP